ncbi:F0F1 ATP synthase subunit epsilon [Kushneria marisflavi]|uniref:ATP synthase epsilon chain n=2 Tax=Kushneria TaxID=504090 RepID=A0A240UQF6_9GAMM|nr:F0F1 ATP synthase subunit epsilon [Kushneria marisflavi]ART63259.1 F0F1 ATP synthase subunit epsilon [Kushneria marisflavi]RKD84290.1 ATP synthase F1 subcomplex epsilon subunit [Kushneria marisflavi]
MATMQCSIVSAERNIFAGEVERVVAISVLGEMGILRGHEPTLTALKPGPVRIVHEGGEEEVFYVSSGFLEVQPNMVIVLADSADRARDLDAAEAEKARDEARRALQGKTGEMDYHQALAEIEAATARLRTLSQLRNRRGQQ